MAPQFQLGPRATEQLYVPSSDGTQVRLSSLAKVEERHTLLAINHIAQFPSATLSFNLAKGYSWARRSRRSVASRPAWSCR
ncbi:efflux RND transporter permease subunit [Pseudomonas aeruginosa]|nr:efflux RND transporter permease subunit [Pseudomonas aeruginosa]